MPADDMEGMSHTELHALVSGARPKDLTSRYTALAEAGSKIEDIAGDLLKLVEKAEWKGESGDALRTWTRGFVDQGANLGAYARAVGDALLVAGEGLTQAKSAMPKPTPGGQGATTESSELERQEALSVIDRLTSYYTEATNQATRPEKPNFVPLSTGRDFFIEPPLGPQVPGGSGLGGGQGVVSPSTYNDSERAVPSATSERPLPSTSLGTPSPDSQVRTGLDSVTTTPEARPLTPAAGPGVPTAGSLSENANSGVAAVPLRSGISPQQSNPPRGSAAVGTSPTPSTALGNPLRQPSSAIPAATAGSTPRPSTPVRDGIHGGTPRPINNAPTQAGMARGTVIGAESGMVGRPAASGNYSPGTPGGSSSQEGTTSRRPLATEPGGVAGRPRSTMSSGQVGSNGGVALTRPPVTVSSPRLASPHSQRGNRQERPHYLGEEEDTWSRRRRNTTPPVIES